jgi:hypothetical protein
VPIGADLVAGASRALCVGIGGGGDVVGALAFAGAAARLGTPVRLGGLTWERHVVDPAPGPRRLDEVRGARPLGHPAVALAGPDAGAGAPPFRFAEGRMAAFLGEEVVLVDPHPGSSGVAAGLAAACVALDCDLLVLLDVGGDVLAHGDEAGLASPLADGVLLAAAAHLPRELACLGVVLGAGCDGELEPHEVAARLAEVEAAGGDRGTLELDEAAIARAEAAVAVVPTEASAMALRCARGERGSALIRGGARAVELTALGGELRLLDPLAALRSAARLAALVVEATSLEDAEARMAAAGVTTELASDRARASAERG